MGERSRSFLKARFQTGAHPNESDFGDLIDSPINWEDVGTAARTLVSANTTAQARERLGITGVSGDTYLDEVGDVSATSVVSGDTLIYVDGSSEWGRYQTGAAGRGIIAGTATSDTLNAIGGNAIGKLITGATTTTQFRNSIGLGAVGIEVVNTSTTSSLREIFGVSVGISLEVTGNVTTTKSTSLSFNPSRIDLAVNIIASATGFNIGQSLHRYVPVSRFISTYIENQTHQAYVSGADFYLTSRATSEINSPTRVAAVDNNGTYRTIVPSAFKIVAQAHKI